MVKVRNSQINKLVKLARRGTIDVDSYIYFQTDSTNASGLVTFSWDSDLPGLPSFLFTLIPGGSVNPSYNHVYYITDIAPSSDFTGTVTLYVGQWDTAVVSSETVLIDSTTPVEGMDVQCLFVHNTLLS